MAKSKPAPDPQHHVHVTLFEEWLEEVWVWFKANWQWPALGIVLGLVIVSIYSWRTNATDRQLTEGWTALQNVNRETEPDKRLIGLRNVIQQYSDPALQAFAYQLLGDLEFKQAMDGSKAGQKEALTRAQNDFMMVLEKYNDQVLPCGNARIGLGLIHENLRQWDLAQKAYKSVCDDQRLVGTPMQIFASERINLLANLKIPLVLGPASSQPATQSASQPVSAL